jgi:two-component system, sensor histidine kinase
MIDEKRHRLTIDFPPDALYVDGDPVRLTQVFGNLLTNAAKYTSPGGAIVLSVDVGDGGASVYVRVKDDGEGISEDMLERVFELFTQAHTSQSRTQTGLGIGLALVRGLVEMHGGAVHASSTGRGHGAEFTVRLPLVQAPQHAAPLPPPAPPAMPKLRLLIIDDNSDLASGLSTYLADTMGHDVRVAHTGRDGIEAATLFKPDAVLLDIGLPDIDGYEVASRLRGQAGLDKAALIALSGFSSDADRARAEGAGFDRYYVKPVAYDMLVDALAATCRDGAKREPVQASGATAKPSSR